MWKCELCGRKFKDNEMGIDLKFGFVDPKEARKLKSQYLAFQPEDGVGPICDDCAIEYIKGER